MKPQIQQIKQLQRIDTIDNNSETYINPENYYFKYREDSYGNIIHGKEVMNYLQLIHKFNVRRYNREV